ncbi:hypothetical protein [Methylobacterium sp. A54F]
MSDAAAIAADPAAVRAFLEVIHSAAAAALEGAHRPGLLQLVEIHPAGGRALSFRFPIGDVERMAAQALRSADSGHNIYIEGRTVAETSRGRGTAADTRGVFAFVVDSDGDKGKAGQTRAQPSLVIETSPGNAHRWFFLDRALTPEQAIPLGAALREAVRADGDSGVVSQPYRVAGTPNFPGKAKVARGRVPTPTRILEHSGRAWSAGELWEQFPARDKPQTSTTPRATGASGKVSQRVEDAVAEIGGDRSSRFHAAVSMAFTDGLTVDDLCELMRRHPEGCGGKYLEPYDRLRREIERSWTKVEGKAEEIKQVTSRPAYEDASGPVLEARSAVDAAVLRFLDAATAYRLSEEEDVEPPAHAIGVTTGVGKTRTAARAIAAHLLGRRGTVQTPKPILYAVPTHRLGAEIERLFAKQGLSARVFRGRQAPDPDRPGQTMCDDVEAVEIALNLGEPVETSCCRLKEGLVTLHQCQHFHTCAYQAQKAGRPDVWIVAHQMLFRAQAALGDVEIVVIDEGFWQSGLRIPKRGLTLNEIEAALPLGQARDDALQNDVESYRALLGKAFRMQDEPGGVRREHLVRAGMNGETCTTAIAVEWRLKEKTTIFPGMPRAERRRAAQAAVHAKHVRAYVGIWNAARGLLYDEATEVSGRLYTEYRDGDEEGRIVVVKARSLKAVASSWRVPTLLLDATLPSLDILRAFFPQVEITATIDAAMPSVRVRQVLDAPVAAGKLKVEEDGANRNLRAIRREILRRFVELGRAPLLVIAQKAVADWLRGSGLPNSISVEHFNNVAGLDQYRDVRGLMVIGRTVPAPAAVEALAGAITGREPALIGKGEWYEKAPRGIRMRHGKPVGLECDAHPDLVAEACRWQICEGELLQAIGRARGVNRTAETPLAIDILANVCLPVTVDAAEHWSPPGEEVDMLIEGIILDSPADMAAAWPETWPSAGAARNWVYRRTGAASHTVTDPYKIPSYIGICDGVSFRYQRPGPRQKWRTGTYEPAVIPDLRAWLESRLGPLAGFDILETAAPPTSHPPCPTPASAADYAPDLAARYRCVVDKPAAEGRLAPGGAEVVRWRPPAPDAPIGFPSLIAARLKLLRAARIVDSQRALEAAE